jgi:ferric-dicitrate binding protein FerR (iron transport regulator)
MSKIDKKRLLKYLDSVKYSGEHKYLIELFAELENHREFSEFLKSDWDKYLNRDENVDKDLSDILRRVHDEIENIEKGESWRKRFIRTYSKVAAIILLPLVVAGVYYISSISQIKELTNPDSLAEVYAPANSRVKYVLPDSSIVWINSGSSIKFHTAYAANRHVELKGKAFFEVTHNPDSPFTVSFKNGEVEVLGTKFSVLSKDNGDFNVVLVEGSVRALVGNSKQTVLLRPDQMLAVLGSKYSIEKVNAKNRIAWVNGELIFRDTPFTDVARRLSDWYDVDIEIQGKGLDDITYRGTFKDESLDDILDLMSLTLPIKSKQVQRKRLPDGSFEKKKVIIYSLK